MSMIGKAVSVVSSTDPTKVGRRGVVMIETAKTLLLDSEGRSLRIEKHGTAFMVSPSREVVTGEDISGRLEDRLAGRRS